MLGNFLEKLIQAYLKENNLSGTNGVDFDFRVKENGDYYIDMWNYEIPKLTFTQQELKDGSLDILKEFKIGELKNNTSNIIYENYSAHKQLNIIGRINGYTDEDFVTMNAFITTKIDECREIENLITACTTIEEVEAIIVT